MLDHGMQGVDASRIAKALEASGGAPAIIVDVEAVLIGVKGFAPGEVFANHVHRHVRETFICLTGGLEVWVDRALAHRLFPGDVATVEPESEHLLRNVAAEPATIIYVKSPNDAADTASVEWTPQEEGHP